MTKKDTARAALTARRLLAPSYEGEQEANTALWARGWDVHRESVSLSRLLAAAELTPGESERVAQVLFMRRFFTRATAPTPVERRTCKLRRDSVGRAQWEQRESRRIAAATAAAWRQYLDAEDAALEQLLAAVRDRGLVAVVARREVDVTR
jgi:hypothetical protein